MVIDKSNADGRDRSIISGDQACEVDQRRVDQVERSTSSLVPDNRICNFIVAFRWIIPVIAVATTLTPLKAQQANTDFSPEIFFAGRTLSTGVTTGIFGTRTGELSGETTGRRLEDGSTEMEQSIRVSDGAMRRRTWRIVRTGPTTIEASGSDVVGKASGKIDGRTLRLVSTIRWAPGSLFGDLSFAQVMELQPDGRTMVNKTTVSKLGVVVQKVDETFVRQ